VAGRFSRTGPMAQPSHDREAAQPACSVRPEAEAAWLAYAGRRVVADRGVRWLMLAGVVFLIVGGDEGGLNVERRM
jgi:hypothetical protein